jgi:hypothetical protein
VKKRPLVISSASPYRSRSRRRAAHPFAVGASIAASGLVALVVGSSLDKRALESSGEVDTKASFAAEQVELDSVDQRVRGEVEELSEVRGKPLLSLERWSPRTSLVRDGVELAQLMNQPLYLRNSLQSGYSFRSAVVDAVWQRAESFLELSFGEGGNGSTLLRFSSGSVEVFFRSRKGDVVSIGKTGRIPDGSSCVRFGVTTTDSRLEVSCNGSTVLALPLSASTQGRVAVASNLTLGEVRELVVDGRVGEMEYRDQR